MIFAYTDETGSTGAKLDLDQPFHFVGSLLVTESAWLKTRNEAKGLLKETGLKELHGKNLWNGTGECKSLSIEERDDIYKKGLAIIAKHKLGLVYGMCVKAKLKRYSKPMHPHDVAFWLCLEKIADQCNQGDSLGLVVVDECRDLSKISQARLTSYRSSGPPFGRAVDLDKIVDNIVSLESSDSPHLQLCDLCLFVINRRAKYHSSDRIDRLMHLVNPLIIAKAKFPNI